MDKNIKDKIYRIKGMYVDVALSASLGINAKGLSEKEECLYGIGF